MIRKHIASAAAGLALMFTITGCGSDPDPVPGGTGSEVDRSSPEATATAFARIFATGDVPAACALANAAGKEHLGSKCERPQAWSTTVTLTRDCLEGGQPLYHFEAPMGSINGGKDDLYVWLVQTDGMWWVDNAGSPYGGVSCDDSSQGASTSASESTG